jgi:hypothetical protein
VIDAAEICQEKSAKKIVDRRAAPHRGRWSSAVTAPRERAA